MNILVLNSGFSSLKFKLIEMPKERVLVKGMVDAIGLSNCKLFINSDEEYCSVESHEAALNLILNFIKNDRIDCVGYRVVHGGEYFSHAVFLSENVLEKIDELSDLAPLHNLRDLRLIKVCLNSFSKVFHVAVFDTAFHQTISEKHYLYAIPYKYYEKYKIRKYGFHGISHKYLMHESCKLLKKRKVSVITCHLGSGSSVCAIKNNKSIETSMGLTPLQGLIMATRSGDIDPALIEFIANKEGLPVEEIMSVLNRKSGLKALSGFEDMRVIYEHALRGNKHCKLAIEMFSARIAHYVGSYIFLLGGKPDAIVFSGGIGEGAFYIRKKVCDLLHIKLDSKKNKLYKSESYQEGLVLSQKGQKIKVCVIATDEEMQIAREAFDLIVKSNYSLSTSTK